MKTFDALYNQLFKHEPIDHRRLTAAEKFYAAGVKAGRAMALKEVQQKIKELAK